jgi:hypothetical protein
MSEEETMAQLVRTDNGVRVVMNPDGPDETFTREVPVNEQLVMGDEDQETFPWEVILKVVPRPEGGTWRGHPKDQWP